MFSYYINPNPKFTYILPLSFYFRAADTPHSHLRKPSKVCDHWHCSENASYHFVLMVAAELFSKFYYFPTNTNPPPDSPAPFFIADPQIIAPGRKAGLWGGGVGRSVRFAGGAKGTGSQRDGRQRRRASGLKGCNGSTATAVRPWGLLSPEVAGRQAAASFRIIE